MPLKPLAPPPGFRRLAQHGPKKVRYVYDMTDSKWGRLARELHRSLLGDVEKTYEESPEYRLRQQFGALELSMEYRAKYKQRPYYHPLFYRRDPLEQVLEHLLREHRYYLKLDIEDAFGSVYPGVHPCLFSGDFAGTNQSKPYHSWPFFHPGDGGLIQGAPASPALFHWYCVQSGFHRMLRETAIDHYCTVTCYMDDVVLSRSTPFGSRIVDSMRRRFSHFGFRLSEHKCGKFDSHRHPIEFLGVSLYREKVKPRPAFYQKMTQLRAMPNFGHVEWMTRVHDLNAISAMVRRNARALVKKFWEEVAARVADKEKQTLS